MAITGFCRTMTQWVPFALVSQGGVFLDLDAHLHTSTPPRSGVFWFQLGKAILSHPAWDDASIHVDTRSTHGRVSGDADETRLLVGADNGDDEGEEGHNGERVRNGYSSAPKHSHDQNHNRDQDRDTTAAIPTGIQGWSEWDMHGRD